MSLRDMAKDRTHAHDLRAHVHTHTTTWQFLLDVEERDGGVGGRCELRIGDGILAGRGRDRKALWVLLREAFRTCFHAYQRLRGVVFPPQIPDFDLNLMHNLSYYVGNNVSSVGEESRGNRRGP
jgi:hypothetical protein